MVLNMLGSVLIVARMNRAPHSYDVIVIGVGGMGSAAACHLARRGARTLALEQFDVPHDLGSSHGISRIIRLAYWEHPGYVPLVRRAYDLWLELQRSAGERLLVVTGSIDAGFASSANIVGVREACRRFQLANEEFDSAALTARFPGYRLPSDLIAILQPEGGFLVPERCIVAHVEAAQRAGAEVHARERVLGWEASADTRGQERVLGWDTVAGGIRVRTDRAEYSAARLVITAGPWTASLVRDMRSTLSPERQVVLWSQPRVPDYFRADNFPVFYIRETDDGFYGFPVHAVPGMKIGKYHHRHETVDPDIMDRQPNREDEEVLREGIRRYFPDADGPTMSMKTCLFTNTRDEHFVIDFLDNDPRIAVAAGFSGHGFKFCSVVGEILADLALDGGTRHDISLFAMKRLFAR
jgi:sarcosine oxidase